MRRIVSASLYCSDVGCRGCRVMPKKPSAPSESLLSYQSMLERHPDHVKAIGMITVEMANLEIMLAQLFGALLNLRPDVADAIYFSPQATGPRIAIVENAVTEMLHDVPDPQVLKDIRRLLKQARDIQGRRNDHVHNAWGLSVETGEVTSSKLPIKRERIKAVPIGELNQLIKRIRNLLTEVNAISPDLNAYVWGVASQNKSPPQDHQQQTPPPSPPKSSSKRPKQRAPRKSSLA